MVRINVSPDTAPWAKGMEDRLKHQGTLLASLAAQKSGTGAGVLDSSRVIIRHRDLTQNVMPPVLFTREGVGRYEEWNILSERFEWLPGTSKMLLFVDFDWDCDVYGRSGPFTYNHKIGRCVATIATDKSQELWGTQYTASSHIFLNRVSDQPDTIDTYTANLNTFFMVDYYNRPSSFSEGASSWHKEGGSGPIDVVIQFYPPKGNSSRLLDTRNGSHTGRFRVMCLQL